MIKRFLTKIGHFFWSWGFLKFVGVLIAIVLLFYAEEDWRGAHAWAVTKAKWEAQDESFDYAKFIPPPVPDEQNLAALPLFQQEPVVSDNGEPYPSLVALKKAERSELPSYDFPKADSWVRGEPPDLAKIRTAITSNFSSVFKGQKPPGDTLAQFEALYPFIADLRSASLSRPLFRLNQDYLIQPPYKRALGVITEPIKISKLLTLHAILAIRARQSDSALADLKLNQEILKGIARDPSLVGALVAMGMRNISHAAIFDGLDQHAWSDAQLTEVERMLEPINFLASYQFAMRCEVPFALGSLDYALQPAHHSELKKVGETADGSGALVLAYIVPNGWWDENRRLIATSYFRELESVDAKTHRVFPEIAIALKRQADQDAARWDAMAPWKIFATISSPTWYPSKFAQGQVWVDETRIACALERYHLAHGVYPASLDALAPAYIDEVPHDIMNGEAYHYRLNPDGTFLLYSVGWNQTDEGGTIAFKKNSPKSIDYENGDWVWPTAK